MRASARARPISKRVMEVLGAALACGPFLSSSVLAAGLLAALDDGAANARLLPGIVAGTTIAAVALAGADAPGAAAATVAAQRVGTAWSLAGNADFVIHAGAATVLLVVADDARGVAVFEVDPHAATSRSSRSRPSTRPCAVADHLRCHPGAAAGGGRQRGPRGGARADPRAGRAGRRAGGRRAARPRHDGRLYPQPLPVRPRGRQLPGAQAHGRRPAARHRIGDLRRAPRGRLRHRTGPPTPPAAVSLAAFTCAEAFVDVRRGEHPDARRHRLHGDHPAHLYLRRARADAYLLGAPDAHRERYLQALEAR